MGFSEGVLGRYFCIDILAENRFFFFLKKSMCFFLCKIYSSVAYKNKVIVL